MAKGQFLGVAACTFALLGGSLVGGAAATASPQGPSLQLAATPAAAGTAFIPAAFVPAEPPLPREPDAPTLPQMAEMPQMPTAQQLKAAQQDPAALKQMVTGIEAMLKESTARLAAAEASALNDQESLNAADELLAERNKAAAEASAQALKSGTYHDAVREQVGQLAGDLYRNGGISPGVTSLLERNDGNDVLYKAATMDALATNRSNALETAQQAAALWAQWRDYSAEAEAAAAEAAGASRSAMAAAENTRSAFASSVAEQRKVRAALIGQLALLRDTSKAEEEQRIAALEAAAREERLQAELAAQPAAPAQAAPAEPATRAAPPEEAPDVVPVATSINRVAPRKPATAKPAAVAQLPGDRTVATRPARTAEQPREPEPQRPASTTPQPAKPASAHHPPAKSAPAKPKPAPPKPQKPRPAPAPEPAPPAPRPAPKPKPVPATAPAGSSVEAAISWALKTAADESNYYVFGANGPDAFDCSSFTQHAFASSGVPLTRTSGSQYFNAPHKVPLSQLKRGDLVFSSSNGGSSFYHVAIYLGNGQVVHARNPSVGISVTPLSHVNNLYAYGARY
jgi:cell wall-associated NlpC family hydrolase